MKIAIDCRMIGSGGIGTYILGLIPWFIKGNQCLLIGTHEQCMDFLRRENVEFCFCEVRPFSFKELFFFPPETIASINQCDVYYTPYCNIPGGIRIPVFSTIHDVVFLDVKGLVSFWGKYIRKWFYRRAIRLSKTVFTVSEFSKKRILQTLGCKKPVVVGYNGISSWLEEPTEMTPDKKDIILFVGNIKVHKGLRILISAFLKVHSQGINSQLVIVGNADNFRTGDSQIKNILTTVPAQAVTFTGKINNKELKVLYQQAKLLIQPSLYEGFGIPPLEALTCGTNVILSDIPVFREIYDEFPVTFFKSGDSDDLAEKIVQQYDTEAPRVIPKKYSYKKTADILVETIKNCC